MMDEFEGLTNTENYGKEFDGYKFENLTQQSLITKQKFRIVKYRIKRKKIFSGAHF